MCNFASFVLTKDRVFYSKSGNSHSEIISENGLNEWGARGPNIIKVEITPTDKIRKWPSLKAWNFLIDQDQLPDWHIPAITEKRARAALLRKYREGFQTVYASGCTALTELKADKATYVNASGCNPKLVIKAKKGATIIR